MNHERIFRLTGKEFSEIDCIELVADWCPLIEIPPHGRLIDADALMNEFKILQSGREIFGMELDSSFLSSGQELSTEWYCVEDAIEDAPTIIEAEDGDGT